MNYLQKNGTSLKTFLPLLYNMIPISFSLANVDTVNSQIHLCVNLVKSINQSLEFCVQMLLNLVTLPHIICNLLPTVQSSLFLANFCIASVGFVGLNSLPVTAPHNPVYFRAGKSLQLHKLMQSPLKRSIICVSGVQATAAISEIRSEGKNQKTGRRGQSTLSYIQHPGSKYHVYNPKQNWHTKQKLNYVKEAIDKWHRKIYYLLQLQQKKYRKPAGHRTVGECTHC